jgi:hypothetical protein
MSGQIEPECPMCGEPIRIGFPLPDACKIAERSIGNACLAWETLDVAQDELAKKERRLVPAIEDREAMPRHA